MAGQGIGVFRYDGFEPNRQKNHIIPHLDGVLKVKPMCLNQRWNVRSPFSSLILADIGMVGLTARGPGFLCNYHTKIHLPGSDIRPLWEIDLPVNISCRPMCAFVPAIVQSSDGRGMTVALPSLGSTVQRSTDCSCTDPQCRTTRLKTWMKCQGRSK